MNTLPPDAVSISNGDVTIDAEVVAPRLGLTVDDLKDKMAKGLVTGVTEAGINEDAGRTRLTFRYGATIWRVVIEADGRLVEDPAPDTHAGFRLVDLANKGS